MSDRLKALSDAGVSIWLDDLSRERIETGNLAELVQEKHVVGVTTNPTIFAAAIADGERYDEQVAQLFDKGEDVDRVVFELTTEDVRNACDIMRPVHDATPYDGRVSIEVEPALANDTEGTIASAKALWAAVDRPNALIKIPATLEGLPAITAATAEGISVNVTLIFGEDRYREVINPIRRWVLIGTALIFGIFAGASASGQWRTFMLWRNRQSFGEKDAYFGKDIGFFVFTLPWMHWLIDFLMTALVIGLIAAFSALAKADALEKADLLSAGISEAMNCTAFGLMVAIPFLLIHAYLQTRTNELVDSLEMACMKLVNARSAANRGNR